MAKRPKRIEVLSANLKHLEEITNDVDRIKFEDILTVINGRKYYDEFKEYELKLIDTNLENCIVGIVITGQNKNLPPKRNRKTGVFSKLNLNIDEETLSFGNIFLYDKVLNVFFYEVNVNGCYISKLIDFIYDEWGKDEDNTKFDLSFPAISRKGEYQRLLDMNFYKEFYLELTSPTEILEDYMDDKSSLFSTIKRYLKDSVNTNSDTMVVKFSTYGKRVNKLGLDRKGLLKLIDSARYLLTGTQRKNVKALKVKGYLTDPDERETITPINLVADTFNLVIKLPVDILLPDVQERERREELEKLYRKNLPELRHILNRGNL